MKEQREIDLAVGGIGEKYAIFRIVRPAAEAAMVRSIQRYGQMSPVVCVRSGSSYELIDGFKRLRAFRSLDRAVLKSKVVEYSERACKAAIIQLNRAGRSITEIEEAMVLQALHREDRLMQIEIATLVGRHKSWVSRRISLIEKLSEEVQEDLRLGLLSVSMARELAKLPRGNQKDVERAILKHRFSIRETEKLIAHLLSRPQWEHQVLLSAPWEIIEPKQPRPVGLEAKLLSFERLCRTLLDGLKNKGIGEGFYVPVERAIGAAEEVVTVLKGLL